MSRTYNTRPYDLQANDHRRVPALVADHLADFDPETGMMIVKTDREPVYYGGVNYVNGRTGKLCKLHRRQARAYQRAALSRIRHLPDSELDTVELPPHFAERHSVRELMR